MVSASSISVVAVNAHDCVVGVVTVVGVVAVGVVLEDEGSDTVVVTTGGVMAALVTVTVVDANAVVSVTASTGTAVFVVVIGVCPLLYSVAIDPDVDPEMDPDDPEPSNVHTSYTSLQQSPLIKHKASQKHATLLVLLSGSSW